VPNEPDDRLAGFLDAEDRRMPPSEGRWDLSKSVLKEGNVD